MLASPGIGVEERDPSPATMALSSAVVTDVSDASDKCVCCMSRVVAASPLSSFAALLEDLESWYTGEGVRGKSSCSLKKMREKKTQGWSHYKQSHSLTLLLDNAKPWSAIHSCTIRVLHMKVTAFTLHPCITLL
jgi:hypothetical protein